MPPTTTQATGTVTAELDGDELAVVGSFTDLSSDLFPVSGSAAHVHNAPEGKNGGIVFNLEISTTDNRSGVFTGSKTLNDEEKDAFKDGNLYVNIHSVDFNGGEIRGQLKPSIRSSRSSKQALRAAVACDGTRKPLRRLPGRRGRALLARMVQTPDAPRPLAARPGLSAETAVAVSVLHV